MSDDNQFDIVVIGGGPGGYVSAIRGAQKGVKVALIEKLTMGGTCLNRGCIPTKTLYTSAKIFSTIKRSEEFGIEVGEPKVKLRTLVRRKDEVVTNLRDGVGTLLKAHGVTVFSGNGYIKNANEVTVKALNGEITTLNTKKIIVASGSEPAILPMFNIDGENIMTSTEILNLKVMPKSLLIIGGGVMGCEFASIFANFGINVTIVEALDSILSLEDKQIARVVQKTLTEKGVTVHTGVMVEKIEVVDNNGVSGSGAGGGQVKTILVDGAEITTEKALVSIGRSFNSSGLGLEDLGVNIRNNGSIEVNEKMETNVEGIYAVGDVTGEWLLAHVASAEGEVAVKNALGEDAVMDYKFIPNGIFTSPEVSSVGLKEYQAKEQGIDYSIGRFPFAANGKAQCLGETEGFVQIISDPKSDVVLGISIVGPHATDIMGEATLAVANGIKIKDIMKTIHAHPTMGENILEAAEDIYGLSIHKVGRKR